MKVRLLKQISQMSRLQLDLHLETSKGDFATLCIRGIAMPLYHFTAAETMRNTDRRPIIGDGAHAAQWSQSSLDLVGAIKAEPGTSGIDRLLSCFIGASDVWELPPLFRNMVLECRPLMVQNISLYENKSEIK